MIDEISIPKGLMISRARAGAGLTLRWGLIVAAACLFAVPAASGDELFERVADMNRLPVPSGSNPIPMAQAGGFVVFAEWNNSYRQGRVWATDGTAPGTVPLLEITELFFEYHRDFPRVAAAGERVLFVASTDDVEDGLWSTDGTAEGTRLLKDRLKSRDIVYHYELAELDGRVYFSADDDETGVELWSTDGTPEGTRLEVDYCAGSYPWGSPCGTKPHGLAVVGHRLLFLADPSLLLGYDPMTGTLDDLLDLKAYRPSIVVVPGAAEPYALVVDAASLPGGAVTYELWRTDGTPAGTWKIKDQETFPAYLTPTGGLAFFTTFTSGFDDDGQPYQNHSLWRSDGSVAGTFEVFPCSPPGSDVQGCDLSILGGTDGWLTFVSGSGPTYLGVTDGTIEGTTLGMETSFEVGGYSSRVYPVTWRSPSGPRLLAGLSMSMLIVSDGTPGGTTEIPGVREGTITNPVGRFPAEHAVVDGLLYFPAHDDQPGWGLWRSDGTPAGTSEVLRESGGTGQVPTRVLGTLGRRVALRQNGPYGAEPTVFDTVSGRSWVIADLNDVTGSAAPTQLAAARSLAYLIADDGVHGPQVWATDTTEGGTRRVGPDVAGWSPLLEAPMVTAGDTGFLVADDPEHGREVWSVTRDRVALLQDLVPGPEDGIPRIDDLLPFRSGFVLQDGGTLWVSTGEPESLRALMTATEDETIEKVVVSNDLVYVVVQRRSNPLFSVLCSDGSEEGTRQILEDRVYYPGVVAVDGGVVIPAHMPAGEGGDYALWISDGTIAGTRRVAENVTFAGSYPIGFVVHRGQLLFSRDDGQVGSGLWKIDLADGSLQLVANVDLGVTAFNPQVLTANGDWVYFVATTGYSQNELWRTDGTTDGTLRLGEVPESMSGTLRVIATPAGVAVYQLRDSGSSSPWRVMTSSGTPESTVAWSPPAGLNVPGYNYNSNPPVPAVVLGNRLLFIGSDRRGSELWSFRLPSPAPREAPTRVSP